MKGVKGDHHQQCSATRSGMQSVSIYFIHLNCICNGILQNVETGMTHADRAHQKEVNNGTELMKRKKSLKEKEKKERKK